MIVVAVIIASLVSVPVAVCRVLVLVYVPVVERAVSTVPRLSEYSYWRTCRTCPPKLLNVHVRIIGERLYADIRAHLSPPCARDKK